MPYIGSYSISQTQDHRNTSNAMRIVQLAGSQDVLIIPESRNPQLVIISKHSYKENVLVALGSPYLDALAPAVEHVNYVADS